MDRVILHSDLNNFFASVECRDNPSLWGIPVAVCGDKNERHGIILAKNMIAKEFGVKTGEPIHEALRKCPMLKTVPAHFEKYLEVSERVRDIYYDYTDMIEPFGLDECWLDVTSSVKLFGGADKIAEDIRRRVKEELGLTVSIGVSFNKIFAKLGSDMKKPDAITYITRENFKEKVWPLPVSDLLFIGKSTERKLNKLNVKTIGKLSTLSDGFLKAHFGKHGITLGKFARGEDNSPVMKYGESAEVKSVGNGNTSAKDLETLEEVKSLIYSLAESVAVRMRKKALFAESISLSIKTDDLESYSVQRKLNSPTASASVIGRHAVALFCESFDWSKTVRAITVCACNVTPSPTVQLDFTGDYFKEQKLRALDVAVENIRLKYSHPTIMRGIVFLDKTARKNERNKP